MQETPETRVRSQSREDPLEEEMATHSSILARKIPWMEELGGLQSMGVTKSRTRLKQLSIYNVPNSLLTIVLAANLNFLKNVFLQFLE